MTEMLYGFYGEDLSGNGVGVHVADVLEEKKMETTHNMQPSSSPEDGDNPLGGNNEIVSQHTTVLSP